MTRRPDPDIYGRRTTSTSRGATHERILARQHEAGSLPGADEVLESCGAGSIGAAVRDFQARWLAPRSVTVRRAYERSLAFLVRDLASTGPHPSDDVSALTADRLAAHFAWRVERGLTDRGELVRGSLHLARLASWIDEHLGGAIGADKSVLRAHVEQVMPMVPPPFNAATTAAELRASDDVRHRR